MFQKKWPRCTSCLLQITFHFEYVYPLYDFQRTQMFRGFVQAYPSPGTVLTQESPSAPLKRVYYMTQGGPAPI